MFGSYIALGDSFTEGLGDPRPDGSLRGWADRVAEGLAQSAGAGHGADADFRYGNLAVRGRKLRPIIEAQVPAALAQRPDLVSINGGGNDMLRPNFSPEESADMLLDAVLRLRDGGSHVLLLSGPSPEANIPLGSVFSKRGEAMTALMLEKAEGLENVTVVDNFRDRGFRSTTYWSEDGLHLAAAGHLRVAANVMDKLELPYPSAWLDPRRPAPNPKKYGSLTYYRSHVAPWVGRRLTGRSSGDGRLPKQPLLAPLPD